MKLSRGAARGQAVIPGRIREAAGLYAGDALAFESDGDRVVARTVLRASEGPLQVLSDTMSEWASAEDEEAWRDF